MDRPEERRAELTHVNRQGDVRMVDVGAKRPTVRRAVAAGRVRIAAALRDAIAADRVAKGSVLQVARIAAIQAAKQTDRLIPLCHSLPLDHVEVQLELEEAAVTIRAEVRTTWKTGVEMEALTAVSVAALTVVDMGKAIDPAMVIESIRLLEKEGGRRGRWRPAEAEADEEGGAP